MTENDAYELLGLQSGASPGALKEAHRRMSKKVHPDQGGSAFLFRQVQEAYELLRANSSNTLSNPAATNIQFAEKLILTLDIGDGEHRDVIIKLRADLAPNHVKRIAELSRERFYDGVVFHRVIDGFMAQGGDPTNTGLGGSDKPDLKPEFSDESHIEGTCSMSRSQIPDSANSQFFICLDDARFLDKQYTVWGQVESGMEHIHALPKGEPPANPGKMVKAKVE